MRTILRRILNSVGRAQGTWLTLLLLLAVLAPSACLLWFMNQAVRNERLAVRQRLVEAYRGHLALAQERLQASWKETLGQIESPPPAPTAFFARLVRSGSADAVVCYDASGKVIYPDSIHLPRDPSRVAGWSPASLLELHDPIAAANAYQRLFAQATNASQAALALQARARCLLQAGNKPAALAVLTGPLAEEEYLHATDNQGRFIVPNAELMVLELLNNPASDQARALCKRLEAQLLDYHAPAMPAAQRRFLMHELLKRFPSKRLATMLAAEELAARYAQTDGTFPRQPGLRPSSLPDVWQVSSTRGQVVLLHRTEPLLARMRAAASFTALPADVRVDLMAPAQEVENALLSVPAGPDFPGWRLALSARDPNLFDVVTRERVSAYLWTGALMVAMVFVLALLAVGMVRRQAALTRLRNDLVANVTHELKTPLSSMRLLVETLLEAPQLHEQTAREYLQLISSENVRLSRLIDNFLTFSRIERNKYTFDFREVPAANLAESAAETVRERFNVPGCHFEVRVPPDLPAVSADPDALVTVLVNLLDNAFKYTGETKEIALSAGAENGSVIFRVRDNGVGLSPRDRKRVFKRFYRADRHGSPVSSGCGLGLSIVRFVVAAHNGTVCVESAPGQGSAFVVRLPQTERDAPREIPPSV